MLEKKILSLNGKNSVRKTVCLHTPIERVEVYVKAGQETGIDVSVIDEGKVFDPNKPEQLVQNGFKGVRIFLKSPDEAQKYWQTETELRKRL